VGWRLELLGLFAGLLILSFEVPKRGVLPWMQGIAAASAAVATGFRIQFVTNPAGGYVYLDSLSVPLTILWVLIILRLREGLRRAVPRPALQLAIDLSLVVNASLLVLISPQTRTAPLARVLPFLLLGIVLTGLVMALRGERLAVVHRTVAFGLALYGISGVMKGPISLSLVAPLALLVLPMVTASPAFLAPGVRALVPRPVPRWFSKRGVTEGEFTLFSLLLVSSFVLGAVLSVHRSWGFGLLALLVIPLLIGGHLVRPIVADWLARRRVDRRAGRSYLFGVGFHSLTFAAVCDRVEEMIHSSGRSHVVVTPNSLSLFRAGRDPSLRRAYRVADLVLPDGIGIVWASRLLGVPLLERVTGIDLAEALLSRARESGYRVFLLGGREGVAARAAHRLKERFPGLDIVGTHHGYFASDAEPLAAIEAASPHILLVGMGVPKQERWMARHADEMNVPVMIGVGGAFDLFAGDCPRASHRWQGLGLEWLYRILHQPRRVRAVWVIPCFIVKVIVARAAVSLKRLALLPHEEV
jgi:N-acetylglucosaminyldiphosphoundecaprenol N-acetyl-beta-D-mannosaminyltransferase